MIVKDLYDKGLLGSEANSWMIDNIIYLTHMGSYAYNVSNNMSDIDLYGITIAPKDNIFPHVAGVINGFGDQIKRFDVYSKAHIINGEATYDVAIYNIVRFFHLLMENNPNIIDSIYTPDRCIIYINDIGRKVRNNRDLFLSKQIMIKMRGYAYSQMKLLDKKEASNEKRAKLIEQFGYDVKFGYQVVRILLEAEMALQEGTIDLERNAKLLRSIRAGEWSYDYLKDWFNNKTIDLESISAKSDLPTLPPVDKIKSILIECLEMKFGNINSFNSGNKTENMINDIKDLIKKYEG